MLRNAPIHAYIPASNIKRARKFCEEIVGLQPREEYAGGVIYECGGAGVFMHLTPNAGTSKASQAFWQVNDVEAEVAEQKARGVKFEEYDMPGVKMKTASQPAAERKPPGSRTPKEIFWQSANAHE